MHRARMNIKIANSVKSYGTTISGHAFRISTVWDEFELRCDELGMNVGYRRISRIGLYDSRVKGYEAAISGIGG
jgi:hypothetical protein